MKSFAIRIAASFHTLTPAHKHFLTALVLLVLTTILFLSGVASNTSPGNPVPPATWALRAGMGLMLLGSVLTFIWSIEEHFSPLED